MKGAPALSTLANADIHRDASFYQDLFWTLRGKLEGQFGPKRRPARIRNMAVYSLDSTVITLCKAFFAWAKYRSDKAGVKVHVLLDQRDLLPAEIRITPAGRADISVAKEMKLVSGSILIMDRGYFSRSFFKALEEKKILFVTRTKDGVNMTRKKTRELALFRWNIRADEMVEIPVKDGENLLLRKITVEMEESGKTMDLLTNDTKFAASTIALLYKDRWQIECFFVTVQVSRPRRGPESKECP
jgi:hypothetical protein